MKPLFTLEGVAVGWETIVTITPKGGVGHIAVMIIRVWNGTFAEFVDYPVALDDHSVDWAGDMDAIGDRIKVNIIHMDCVSEVENFAVTGKALFFGEGLSFA